MNCLITKLNTSVNDAFLPTLNEIRFNVYANIPFGFATTVYTQFKFKVVSNTGIISYINSETITAQGGFSGYQSTTGFTEDSVVYVPYFNKSLYYINNMTPYNDDWSLDNRNISINRFLINKNIPINVSGLSKHNTIFQNTKNIDLPYNNISSTNLTGNFSEFKNCKLININPTNITMDCGLEIFESNTQLEYINIQTECKLKGSLHSLSHLNLTYLYLISNQFTGNINDLSNSINTLSTLDIPMSQIYGTTEDISKFTKLMSLNIQWCYNITGDISYFSSLPNIKALYLNYTNITGSKSSIQNLIDRGCVITYPTSVTD